VPQGPKGGGGGYLEKERKRFSTLVELGKKQKGSKEKSGYIEVVLRPVCQGGVGRERLNKKKKKENIKERKPRPQKSCTDEPFASLTVGKVRRRLRKM